MTIMYNPVNIINELERSTIYPFQHYGATLVIICPKNRKITEDLYIKNLLITGKEYKARVEVHECETEMQAALKISNARADIGVSGIIVVGSFGDYSDRALKNLIPSRLDIDGGSKETLGNLMVDNTKFSYFKAPCAAFACYKAMEEICHTNDFSGLKVAIVGRSVGVGIPLFQILCKHNATVTIFHSHSTIKDFKDYDIVFSAVGTPYIWKPEFFREGQIIIDVGFTIDDEGAICGDIHSSVVETLGDKGVFSKSPGGIGLLTRVCLFSKLFYNSALMNGERI